MCYLFTEIIFFLKLLTRDQIVLISCENIVQSIHLIVKTTIFFYQWHSMMFVSDYKSKWSCVIRRYSSDYYSTVYLGFLFINSTGSHLWMLEIML